MTVFADHLDLRTAVVEAVRDASIADVFPRLVKLAEASINRRLRCREQIATAALTFTGDLAPLPADLAQIIGVYDGAGREYRCVTLQDIAARTGIGAYAVIGSNIKATGGPALSLQYYGKIATIADSLTGTNWLLEKHPSLYLYAVAAEAAKHLRDVDGAQAFGQLTEAEYQAAAAEDSGQRHARIVMRTAGPTP